MGYKVVSTPKKQLFDIPIIGDHLAKIGRVIDLWADPCKPDPVVWVYAFWQAIPTFAASLTKPELIDINIEHRRGKPRKGVKNKMKVDLLLRDALIEIPVPRWVPFRVYELSQRIGWYFLVADATEQMAINWMSLAYRYNGCQTDLLKYLDASNDHVIQHASTGPGVEPFIWNTSAVDGISWDGSKARLLWPGKYRVNWYTEFAPYPNPPQSEIPYNTAIYVDEQPYDIGEVTHFQDAPSFASGGSLIDYDGGLPQPTIQIKGSYAQGVGFNYMTGVLDISRVSDTELSPDP
jgi:hypothetical protein